MTWCNDIAGSVAASQLQGLEIQPVFGLLSV